MNKLLPTKDELYKITEEWTTFADTSFQDDFDKLSIENKLQILNDIIRQTILFKSIPNPETEEKDLIGDSYTACIVAINYLKSFNIGTNFRIAFVRNPSYEKYNNLSNELSVLLDYEGKTYYFNCSPYIGAGIGKVCELKNQKYFNEIIEFSSSELELIKRLRELTYKQASKVITVEQFKELKTILNELKNNPKTEYFSLSNFPKSYDTNMVKKQINDWQEELNELKSLDINYKRQIELAQNMLNVLIELGIKNKRFANIDGNLISLSELSPRFFFDNNLTAVCIKPSAYLIGKDDEIKKEIIGDCIVTGSYKLSLGEKSKDFGLEKMKLFHPHGYKYLRSMKGPSEMFLVHNTPSNVGVIKKQIRTNYANDIKNTNVKWFDGEPIFWDPIITNLLHSTDDACEASLHYVSGYPEYSLMTRFMYPNPILRKELKK